MPTTTELTQTIKALAQELGFQKVGIIPSTPLQPEAQRLSEWLQQGYNADMAWMETYFDIREKPASLMEGSQSLVCVAMNYFPGDFPDAENISENELPVKIGRYAQGTDYHYVLKYHLKTILKALQKIDPTIRGRAFTDSAPLMEKALATRAGLGWMGKNGNLLTQDYGSWLFLGELLLNVQLDYDTPYTENLCGTCTRCITACPTEAITQPGVVDANKCLSYWTIEYKGEAIPQRIAEKMDGWVFGCDICQEVCPWNIRFQKPTTEPEFQPRPWNQQPTAQSLLSLDEETFKVHYHRSSLKRAKLSGLQRNVENYIQHRPK